MDRPTDSKDFAKRALLLLVDGLTFMNKKQDLFGVDLTEWSEEIHYQVTEQGLYDDILAELCQKYSRVLSPEEKLLMMLGSSLLGNIATKKAQCECVKTTPVDTVSQNLKDLEPIATNPPSRLPSDVPSVVTSELLARLASIRKKMSDDLSDCDSETSNGSSDWNSTIDGVTSNLEDCHLSRKTYEEIDGYMSF